MPSKSEIFENVRKESKGKFGMICLNCLLKKASDQEIISFAKEQGLEISEKKTKLGFLEDLTEHFYEKFKENKDIKKDYGDTLNYLGQTIIASNQLGGHISEFDFYSQQELIDKFADFCADLEISVYNASEVEDFDLDLFLIRRTPLLRTEAVLVRTGYELEKSYEKVISLLLDASKISTWLVFVTTPAGVMRMGLEKLIKDMEKLNVWLYVVDPVHKHIMGVTKGKKSKDYDTDVRDQYIAKLPREPIRAPSQVVKISKYYFSEGDSYKSKNYTNFELISDRDDDSTLLQSPELPKYQKIFREIIIIENVTGLSIFSYGGASDEGKGEDLLVSGFLQAMDNFVSELGSQGSTLKDISYKGFNVQGNSGEYVKVALFLTEKADQILKERLKYFIRDFETKFKEKILRFQKNGNVSEFTRNPEITKMVREILAV